jgi:DNA-binding SARP family transcriptional activator
MDFRILGPLEVWDGDRPLVLGGARERSVLAALLISANRVMPAERLVTILWGEDAPETAANTLQVHVSHLRHTLEPERERRGPGALLLTRPPGYELRTTPASVDAARFERGADRGGAMLGSRPAEAVEVLGAALAEWRGPALVEFRALPFALAEAQRLEERRLAATEQRVEAELALGRHQALAAELESLVRDHPLRERLVGLRMLALYRSGRQADALRSCTELRERLREELGIDPSPEIRALERAILVQDPALTAPAAGAPRAAPGPLPVGGGAILEVATGSGRELVQLATPRTRLGRDAGNDVVLQGDATVSRRHAEISHEAGGWLLRDLGSANGSYVSGTRVQGELALHDGDEIRLGQARLRFRLPGSDSSTLQLPSS